MVRWGQVENIIKIKIKVEKPQALEEKVGLLVEMKGGAETISIQEEEIVMEEPQAHVVIKQDLQSNEFNTLSQTSHKGKQSTQEHQYEKILTQQHAVQKEQYKWIQQTIWHNRYMQSSHCQNKRQQEYFHKQPRKNNASN